MAGVWKDWLAGGWIGARGWMGWRAGVELIGGLAGGWMDWRAGERWMDWWAGVWIGGRVDGLAGGGKIGGRVDRLAGGWMDCRSCWVELWA